MKETHKRHKTELEEDVSTEEPFFSWKSLSLASWARTRAKQDIKFLIHHRSKNGYSEAKNQY